MRPAADHRHYIQTPALVVQGNLYDKTCKYCGKQWVSPAKNAMFCCTAHRTLWRKERKGGA